VSKQVVVLVNKGFKDDIIDLLTKGLLGLLVLEARSLLILLSRLTVAGGFPERTSSVWVWRGLRAITSLEVIVI
jgi:hypothetical protein